MNAREFEDYVTLVIKQLTLIDDTKIFRNERFEGVRQPGKYEVDIAIKYRLYDLLDILLIIECKNWSKPVDRPIIQNLAQTKDALSAHKAAVVSSIGFTKEAISVAKNLGIALWVISEKQYVPSIFNYCKGFDFDYLIASIKKQQFPKLNGIEDDLALIDFSEVDNIMKCRDKEYQVKYFHYYHESKECQLGINKKFAVTQIVDLLSEIIKEDK